VEPTGAVPHRTPVAAAAGFDGPRGLLAVGPGQTQAFRGARPLAGYGPDPPRPVEPAEPADNPGAEAALPVEDHNQLAVHLCLYY